MCVSRVQLNLGVGAESRSVKPGVGLQSLQEPFTQGSLPTFLSCLFSDDPLLRVCFHLAATDYCKKH